MLKDKNFMTMQDESDIIFKTHQWVDRAFAFARQSGYPSAQDALKDVFVSDHSNARALT
jgi:TPP-dependent pyruvate/acetoin dehydrogenase alpha subunit